MEKEVHVDTYVEVEIEFDNCEVLELLSDHGIDLSEVCEEAYSTDTLLAYITELAEDKEFKRELLKAIGDEEEEESSRYWKQRHAELLGLLQETLNNVCLLEQRVTDITQGISDVLYAHRGLASVLKSSEHARRECMSMIEANPTNGLPIPGGE
jgi:hypothetical protein